MRTVISETAEAIGWHQHGRQWVWGIASGEGCKLCDLAERWLAKQDIYSSQVEQLSMEDQLSIALKSRRAANRQEPEEKTTAPLPSKSKLKKEELARRQRSMF